MPTEFIFRDDAYQRETAAFVLDVTDDGGIVLDRTVFYAQSGGQPGDTGRLTLEDGRLLPITNTVHPGDKAEIVHLIDAECPLAKGDPVIAVIDWDRRYRMMRMHTALHLLSVAFPFPVTGGSISDGKGRLDFDMPEVPENVEAIEAQLNAWIEADLPVNWEWITEEELDAKPDLVKTMSVKPPRGQGRVRLVRIGSEAETVDLQPCGGTHVRSTGEIGPVQLGKIEKKGKQNRRVSLLFAES